MGEIKRCEFRANWSCRERDAIIRKRRATTHYRGGAAQIALGSFLQRSGRSMRIFRRSKILRQSRSVFDDAIFCLIPISYRALVRNPRGKDFLIAFSEVGERRCLYKHRRGGRIALRSHQEKNLRDLLRSSKLCWGAIEVLALEAPVDAIYGGDKSRPGTNRPTNWRERPAHSRSRTDAGPYGGNRQRA